MKATMNNIQAGEVVRFGPKQAGFSLLDLPKPNLYIMNYYSAIKRNTFITNACNNMDKSLK